MRWLAALALSGYVFFSAIAQELPVSDLAANQQASVIRQQLGRYVDAVNQREYKQLESLLHEDVTYQDESLGLQTSGREPLIAQIKQAMNDTPDRLTANVVSIEMTDDSTVVVTGVNSIGTDQENAARIRIHRPNEQTF